MAFLLLQIFLSSSNLGQNQGTNKWTDELDDGKTEEGFSKHSL